MRLLLVEFGLVAFLCVTAWFNGSNLLAKNHIEMAKLEVAKPDAESPIHQRVLIMALPGQSSEISLCAAAWSPTVTTPVEILTDPAQTNFLSKVRVA